MGTTKPVKHPFWPIGSGGLLGHDLHTVETYDEMAAPSKRGPSAFIQASG
tara:strand:- start:241 stop:390 length:150 start_codon:yes stop_codon:yes gene_type:complete